MATGSLKIDPQTHSSLKRFAKDYGQHINRLADSVLRSWLRGEAFFLPPALRMDKRNHKRGTK